MQSNDNQIRKLQSAKLSKEWVDIKGVFQYKGFPYILEITQSELISQHYNNSLADHFRIDKTRELIARKYY